MPGRVLLDNLVITDGTTAFRFFDASVMLQSWRPAVGALRGGGTWRTPTFDSGSSLVLAEYDDITDVFELCVLPAVEDNIYATFMDLVALLEKARYYWIDSYAVEPVWIEARGPDETNTRYATIKDWRIPGLGRGPFDPEFVTCLSKPNQTIQLTLVHAIWQSTPPLEPECLEISAEQAFDPLDTELTLVPTQQDDDGYAWDTGTTMDIASNWLRLGNQGVGILETAIRFRNVAIPPGSRISSAFIRFRANANLAAVDVHCLIKGERNTAPAVFTAGIPGYNNEKGRFRTLARTPWKDIPAWVVGTDYDTPDISAIVEEIVGLATWASGNDLVIFIDDHPNDPSTANAYREARSWDSGANEPELHVLYDTGTTFGRSETCAMECYVANKHNHAQLTDVYWHDVSLAAWSGNLMTAGLPFNILPNPVQNGDFVYFGINAAHVWQGPFSSLVFDIGTATVYSDLGAACNITWEYWNGAAWVALAVCDNTCSSYLQDHPFQETGVNSVHWVQPSNWATTTINGVLAWWVRGAVNIGGGESITPVPTQQNRAIYTCCWPYVDVADDQVDGDIGALLRMGQNGASDIVSIPGGVVTWNITRYIDHMIVGLRSVDRGEYFTPYLNAGNSPQNIRLFSSYGSNGAFVADPTSPTGQITRVTYAGATAALAMEQQWIPWYPTQFYGRYRAFLRYKRTAGSDGDIRVQLRTYLGEYNTGLPGALWVSEERDLPVEANEYLVHDFGLVTLPPGGVPSEPSGNPFLVPLTYIEVWLQNTFAGARVVDIIDLVLMPADEFLVEFRNSIPSIIGVGNHSPLYTTQYLLADSTRPKGTLEVEKYISQYEVFVDRWIGHNTGRMQLHPRKQQRLWWFMARTARYRCAISALTARHCSCSGRQR